MDNYSQIGRAARDFGNHEQSIKAQSGIQAGIEAPEPASIFTETALSINGHTNSIHDMAATVRRCCDMLVGSVPEPASDGNTMPETSPHQIPRLNQALCEQAEALQYLQSQLMRLDAALAGNSTR